MKRSLIAALFLAGCAHPSPGPDNNRANQTSDAAFAALSEGYIRGHLEWRPQAGTGLGLHHYDGRLTDYSKASIQKELDRLKDFDQQMSKIRLNSLSSSAAYDYRILQSAIKMEIFNFEDMAVYTKNPMTYAGAIDVNIYVKRNFAPLQERVKSLIAIERQAPAVIAAAKNNLEPTLAKPLVETAIEVANGSADFLSKELVEALRELRDQALQEDFQKVNAEAIAALRGFAEYLKTEKLPRAHAQYALGRDKYQRMLQVGEWINSSPEQILELGLRELKREQEIFTAAARKIDSRKAAIDVFKDIQKDHPTEESLIPDTKKTLESIRQFLVDHRIVTLPSAVRAQVKETPQFLRATSFASMDTPGPFETQATEAYYYVTPVEKDWPDKQKEEWLTAFNYYTTDIVSVHEAYPGHYTQDRCLNASGATRLEKIFSSYAFNEGWAHYAEQMMVDEGFGAIATDPSRASKYRLAQSDEALLRLCRLCVSVKTHCQNMSVDEATKFFRENCYYEEKPARQEAIRGVFDPGYLYYTLGKLQILKLRRDFKEQEGSAYSLQQFHDELLRHGMPSIRLLREVMLKDKRKWNEIF